MMVPVVIWPFSQSLIVDPVVVDADEPYRLTRSNPFLGPCTETGKIGVEDIRAKNTKPARKKQNPITLTLQ